MMTAGFIVAELRGYDELAGWYHFQRLVSIAAGMPQLHDYLKLSSKPHSVLLMIVC